jgi:hypothetical protein
MQYLDLLLSHADETFATYSLQVGKRSHFRQQYGLQSITLTLFFYKNIYLKVIYVYFYESIFQDKSIHIIFTFSINNLKVIHDLYFQYLTQTLSKTTSFTNMEGVHMKHLKHLKTYV